MEKDVRAAILEILTEEVSNYSPPFLLNRIIRKISEFAGVDGVYVTTWEQELGLARAVAVFRRREITAITKPQKNDVYDFYGRFGKSPPWFEMDAPQTVDIRTAAVDSIEFHYFHDYGIQSALFIPLSIQKRMIGCLELVSIKGEKTFTTDIISFCQALLPALIGAFTGVRFFNEEAQRRHEMETLNEVAQILSGTMELDEIFHKAIAALRVYLYDVKNFSISIVEDGTYLRNRYSWQETELPEIVETRQRVPIAETFSSKFALESGEPFTISNLQNMPLMDKRTQKLIAGGLQSILYVPLKYKNEVFGLLHINAWHEPRAFTPEEISLCKGVATQVAIAIANSRLYTEKNKQLHLAQTIQKVGALLTASLPLKEVYQQIFDLLAEVVAYDAVSLFLIDESTGNFVVGDARGLEDSPLVDEIARLFTHEIMKKIPRERGWRVVENVAECDEWEDLDGMPNPGSWIGAALIAKDRLIGILNVDSERPYAYTDEHGQTVSVFANQAAVAIENARLYDAILQQATELSVLHTVALRTATTMDVDKLLQQTTELIVDKLYPDMFGFLLVNADERYVYPHESYHGIDKSALNITLPFDDSITGMVARKKQLILVDDTSREKLFVPGLPESRSELAVPVIIGEECVAVINVESRQTNAFDSQDIIFLTTLARNVAAAIEKAQLYETLMIQADALAEEVAAQTHSLQLERDRMVAILENVQDGIVFADDRQIIQYANPAFLVQTGFSLDQIAGRKIDLFVSGEDDQKAVARMWQALKNKQPWTGELIYSREDGSAFDVKISATASMDSNENVHGYVIVHGDISHFKEVERLKSGFISNISHELRTPLTNINTYLTLLERGSEEKRPAYFKTLYQQGEKLNRLIQDLIDISRLDAQLAPELVGRTNLFDLLGMFWQRYESRARQLNLNIRQHYDMDTLVSLPAVKVRFEDADFILSKIIDNALSFSLRGGDIEVTVGERNVADSSFVWLGIKDSGPGISVDEFDHIFDRFYRGKIARENNLPGTGLGLALAHELLDRLGGWIDVESQPGEGALFRIFLPSE